MRKALPALGDTGGLVPVSCPAHAAPLLRTVAIPDLTVAARRTLATSSPPYSPPTR